MRYVVPKSNILRNEVRLAEGGTPPPLPPPNPFPKFVCKRAFALGSAELPEAYSCLSLRPYRDSAILREFIAHWHR